MAKLSLISGRIDDSYLLPSPSFGLNRALGGGFKSGRIHVLWGPKASGKSSLALQTVGEAQKQGKRCLWVDSEKTYNPVWAENCGVDLDSLLLAQQGANVAEDLLTLVLPPLEKQEIDVIVIDSLSSVLLSSFFEKPESNPVGVFARSAKFILIKLLNALSPQTEVFLISHASIDMSGYHPILTASIGNAVQHWASSVIKLRQGNHKDNDFRADGSRQVYWTIEKSKQSLYPVSGTYWFNAESGQLDTLSEIVDSAIDTGIITQSGAWFKMGEHKWQGKNGVLNAVNTDLLIRDEIVSQVLSTELKQDQDD